MRIERAYLRNYAATNGTRTCIYDCVEARWTCRCRGTETYICTNTRASRFLRRVATYISSTPFCGRASPMKNYVAHHDKRKVKPYERPRHISLSYTRKRSKHRITLIERKTSSTSTITSVLFLSLFFLSSLFLLTSLLLSGALAHSGEIQLSPLYRSSTGASALRSLNASHRMIRGITRRRIMRFIILMRQPAKQDLYDIQRRRVQGQRAPG